MKYKHKTKHPFYFSTGFLLILGVIILILIAGSFWRTYQKKQAINQEIERIKQDIERYETENEELKKMAQYLETDEAIKKQAKMNLGYKEKGEKVVVVTEEDKKTQSESQDDSPDYNQSNNFINWFNYFFK